MTISYPMADPESSMLAGLMARPTYVTYSNLPLTGSHEITIPDDESIRDSLWGYLLLYIIEDGVMPPAIDSSLTLIYEH